MMKSFATRSALGLELALVAAALVVSGNAWACEEEEPVVTEAPPCETEGELGPAVPAPGVVPGPGVGVPVPVPGPGVGVPVPVPVTGGCVGGVGCVPPVVTTTTSTYTLPAVCTPLIITVWGIPQIFCAPGCGVLGAGIGCGWPGLFW